MIKQNHPYANLFPMIEAEDFVELKKDIDKNGLLTPIILHEDKILDGRNRYKACVELGVEPRFEEYDGTNPLQFVISLNLKRRHLNKQQSACIAVNSGELMKELEEEARKRQIRKPKDSVVAKLPQQKKTREVLAEAFHTSARYVQDAKKLKEEAPEFFEKVQSGEASFKEYKRKKLKEKVRVEAEKVEKKNSKRDKIKVLNLYAGIGGNRKLWKNCDVTAVEFNDEIIKIYKKHFPNDTVIKEDAVKYLLEHFQEYDFIWASPPCPTHSKMRTLLANKDSYKLPDMTLYSIILFLQHFFKGKWIVENVISYYDPLIKPNKVGTHYFWSNIEIPYLADAPRGIKDGTYEELKKNVGFNLDSFEINKQHKIKYLRNCVIPEVGLYVFETVLGGSQ